MNFELICGRKLIIEKPILSPESLGLRFENLFGCHLRLNLRKVDGKTSNLS